MKRIILSFGIVCAMFVGWTIVKPNTGTGQSGSCCAGQLFYDEDPAPLATNGPGNSPLRLGAVDYKFMREVRTRANSTLVTPTNIYLQYESIFHTGETPTVSVGGKWPYIGKSGACPDSDGSGPLTGGTWPSCDIAKNHVGNKSAVYIQAGEAEGSADLTRVYCPGAGDCLGRFDYVYATGFAPASGDEGALGERKWLFDMPEKTPTGTTSAAIVGGTSTSVTTTINSPTETIRAIGKHGLMVFDDAAYRRQVSAAAGGLLDYNGYGKWTVREVGDLPASMGTMDSTTKDTGWCFKLNNAAKVDGAGVVYDNWLLVTHGPGDPDGCELNGTTSGCSSDSFETTNPAAGTDDGAPYHYVSGTDWTDWVTGVAGDDGVLAPCEQINYVDFAMDPDSGGVKSAASYTVNFQNGTNATRQASLGNIATNTAWEYAMLGNARKIFGDVIVMDLLRADNQDTYAYYASNSTARTDDQTLWTSVFGAKLFVGTNPTRAISQYGIEFRGPVASAALRYAPYYTSSSGFAEPAATVQTVVDTDDWNSATANKVVIDRVMSSDSGSTGDYNLYMDTDNTRLVFQNATAATAVTITGEDSAGASDTIFDTTGAGTVTIGSADVTNVSVVSDGGTAQFNGLDGSLLFPTGAAPGATCTVGQIFIDTDETNDSNCTTTADNSICVCHATNTWDTTE